MRTRRLVVLLLLAYWGVLFAATHLPPRRLPSTRIDDKIEHIGAFFLLSTLLYIGLRVLRPAIRGVWWKTALIVLAYAALDEWTQLLVGRTCDFRDWLADATGMAIAVGLMVLLFRLMRFGAPGAAGIGPPES